MKVTRYKQVNAETPILKVRANKKHLVAMTPRGVLPVKGPTELGTAALSASFDRGVVDFAVDDRCLVVVLDSGDFVVRLFATGGEEAVWLPRFRVAAAEELRAVTLLSDQRRVLLGAGRFVLDLALDALIAAGQATPGARFLPLQSAWGAMHGLHTDSVVAVVATGDLVLSAAHDGLVIVAKRAAMDTVDTGVVLGTTKVTDDELCDSKDDLLVFCVSVGEPVREILVKNDILVVLTETNQTAIYKVAALSSGGNISEEFVQLQPPSRAALGFATEKLWSCPGQCASPTECLCDEPGIVDAAGLLLAPDQAISALFTHAQGRAGLVELVSSGGEPLAEPRVKEVIHNLRSDYVRCAQFVGRSLILGTEQGFVFHQSKSKKQKPSPSS